MGYTVFACIILIAALVGFLFKKNGELAGLGRESKRGGLRAPHGRLVRTKRLDSTEDLPFLPRLGICLAVVAAVTMVIGLIAFVGLLSWGSMFFVGIHLILCIAACAVIAQSESGVWRPLAYAFAGYLVFAIIPSLMWAFEVPPVAAMQYQNVNMLTVILAAFGCALVVACMPSLYAYAREFEDGYVNAIQVSSRSVARRAYDALLDPSWKPPADRVENYAAAEDPRSFMEKR